MMGHCWMMSSGAWMDKKRAAVNWLWEQNLFSLHILLFRRWENRSWRRNKVSATFHTADARDPQCRAPSCPAKYASDCQSLSLFQSSCFFRWSCRWIVGNFRGPLNRVYLLPGIFTAYHWVTDCSLAKQPWKEVLVIFFFKESKCPFFLLHLLNLPTFQSSTFLPPSYLFFHLGGRVLHKVWNMFLRFETCLKLYLKISEQRRWSSF